MDEMSVSESRSGSPAASHQDCAVNREAQAQFDDSARADRIHNRW